MIFKGKLHVASPIYRGNARKTLFTRDGDGVHRLVSLAGEVQGTAQSLMDAFIGSSKNGKNIGLLNRLWLRLYGSAMPGNLITKVECNLHKDSYPRNNFFDLRMGIRLDEDRWAAEANANYKMETILKNSVFDLVISVNDSAANQDGNAGKVYYLLEEIKAGRFWFGAGKSKGLGRLHLEMDLPFKAPAKAPEIAFKANHLEIDMVINAQNPILVGWNWGKVDPHVPSFHSTEARMIIGAMRDLPESIRDRLEMSLGGVILNLDDWKKKFAEYLPRITAIWLKECSSGEAEFWTLPAAAIKKLGKGKHALNPKLLESIEPLADKPFKSQQAAEDALKEALGKKANMAKRILEMLEHQKMIREELDLDAWAEVVNGLGLDKDLKPRVMEKISNETALTDLLSKACQSVLPRLFQQVDQHMKMLQSDAWVDAEIQNREEHLRIKQMLMDGKIGEREWNNPKTVPEGIRPATWREFIEAHSRVQFQHMLNRNNLKKSVTNDRNHVEFLKFYREQTRQELSQPHHIDFRAGGIGNREISRQYGKPYDTVFMRMLIWTPSSREQGTWEVYIPGSTIKGAFRRRASQLLKTLWGEGRKTDDILNLLFGRQGQVGLIFFSDAYLSDPRYPEKSWCSVDGIKMDTKTGQPIDSSKRDYLFAYGRQLAFRLRMDIQDIGDREMEALNVFFHLLEDFQKGDIPIGGEKTSGFGWVKAQLSGLNWLTASPKGIHQKLFAKHSLKPQGIWQALALDENMVAESLRPGQSISGNKSPASPPVAKGGFISHRSFGGHCGILFVEAEALTPINVQESGEPSFSRILDDGPVNGWDFFSLSPAEAEARSADRIYAIPSRSIKGMLRNIYTIASNSKKESPDIGRLNPVDTLFGWVGEGPNQALMGRLSFTFGEFDKPEMSWFKAPYPYGNWQYTGAAWKQIPGKPAPKLLIENQWRIFPHAPLAPIARPMKDFAPDVVQARYFRAVMPGSRARFSIRFWNLLDEELQRLLWCVVLEPGLAHKIGNNRYLGFGSLRLNLGADSFLIDWDKRYAGKSEDQWRIPVEAGKRINTNAIQNYKPLRQALNAECL